MYLDLDQVTQPSSPPPYSLHDLNLPNNTLSSGRGRVSFTPNESMEWNNGSKSYMYMTKWPCVKVIHQLLSSSCRKFVVKKNRKLTSKKIHILSFYQFTFRVNIIKTITIPRIWILTQILINKSRTTHICKLMCYSKQ